MKRIIFRFKLFFIACLDKWAELLLDLFTLIGSAVTIFFTYYKDGIVLNNYKDFGIDIFLIIILLVWIYRAYKTIFHWNSLDLPKDTFFDYLPLQLEKASTKIKSIAGDVSWLEDQKSVYYKLIANNPHMNISIYYSGKEVANKKRTMELIEEYGNRGLKMIPYPYEVKTEHIKGILIDPDAENARFLSFSKIDEGDKITCTKFYASTNEFHLANSFVNSIDSYILLENTMKCLEEKNESKIREMDIKISECLEEIKEKKCVYVGVSGLNNIGKSTLCDTLKRKYSERVVIIRDPFISDIKSSSFDIALFCLLNQILEFQTMFNEIDTGTIFIFDRTPIDNYAFLRSYKNSTIYDRYVERLESAIQSFMDCFDLIILLTPEEGYKFEKTSRLKSDYRRTLSDSILELYERMHQTNIQSYVVSYSKKGYKKKIQELAKEISTRIDSLWNES